MQIAQVNRSTRLIGLASGLAATSIWGGMYVVSKVVMEVIPPFTLIVLRLLLGMLVLWMILAMRGDMTPWGRFTRRQFWNEIGVGLIGYGISLSFQFVGTKLSTASNGALVTSATPAFVLSLASLILKERITRRKVAALLLSTQGVLAVIDPRNARISPDLM